MLCKRETVLGVVMNGSSLVTEKTISLHPPTHPVSPASLAYRSLRWHSLTSDATVLRSPAQIPTALGPLESLKSLRVNRGISVKLGFLFLHSLFEHLVSRLLRGTLALCLRRVGIAQPEKPTLFRSVWHSLVPITL
jgi:hypothetical protein